MSEKNLKKVADFCEKNNFEKKICAKKIAEFFKNEKNFDAEILAKNFEIGKKFAAEICEKLENKKNLAAENWEKTENFGEKNWGNAEKNLLEDERRLFFVAATRAQNQLFLSFAEKNFDDRAQNPSIFWHEIPENLAENCDEKIAENSAAEILPVLLTPQKFLLTKNEKKILENLAANFVWSATSLQNFLDCPRKFFFENFLRIPILKKQKKLLIFGKTVHRALEFFLKKLATEKTLPSKNFLLEKFEKFVKNENLPTTEISEILARGREILGNYFEKNRENFCPEILVEYSFFDKNISVDGVKITGKIDKIEFDKSKKLATIVDFKTGKFVAKKLARGENLWRQLVFYDLLVRGARLDFAPKNFALEFLVPDARGDFPKKFLEISADDRAIVVDELKSAQQKIAKLEFPRVENLTKNSEIEFWQNFGNF